MIVTILSLFAVLEAAEPGVSRTAAISLVPEPERVYLEVEIRENGKLIASPSIQIVEGETASLAVGGPQGYRIDLLAEPSPVTWYAPEAGDDVFVSSRLFLAGGETGAGDWQRIGDAMVSVEPGSEAAAEFNVSGAGYTRPGMQAPLSQISVSYRMRVLTN